MKFFWADHLSSVACALSLWRRVCLPLPAGGAPLSSSDLEALGVLAAEEEDRLVLWGT